MKTFTIEAYAIPIIDAKVYTPIKSKYNIARKKRFFAKYKIKTAIADKRIKR